MTKKSAATNRTARGDASAHAVDLSREIARSLPAAGDPEFFNALVRYLAHALGVGHAFVAELTEAAARVRTIAAYADGDIVANFERRLSGSVAEQVIHEGLCVYPAKVRRVIANDPELHLVGAESCVGAALHGAGGECIGVLVAFGREPLRRHESVALHLQLLAALASAELRARQQAPALAPTHAESCESQRLLTTLMSNIPGMVYRCRNDRDWTVDFASDGCLALTGYPASDFTKRIRSYNQIIDPVDQERIWNEVQAAVTARTPYQLIYRIRPAAGGCKWVWEQGGGIYGRGGELVCLEGFVADITERRHAEESLRASEERFKSLTELSSDWYWEQDAEFRFTLITHNVDSPTRPAPEVTIGYRRWELPFYDEMTDAEWAPHKAALAARLPFEDFLVKRRGPKGERRYSSVSGVPTFDVHGDFTGYRGTGRDVTARMHAEAQMRKLSSAIQQTADCVMITDRNGVIEYVNAAFEHTTGYATAEALGGSPSLVRSGQHEHHFYKKMWDVILSGETFRDVFINRKKTGELYYEEKTISPLRDGHGEITHFISTGKDITERMQVQERLQYLAHHDALTGLPNRVLFLDRLNQALLRGHWHKRVVGVMFLDLDRFKNINDTLGHDVGDALLKGLAGRLQERVRDGDTVARLGGDEFAMLLDDVAHAEDVAAVANKLLDAFTLPFAVAPHELFITASIGISLYPNDGTTAAALLKNADAAMYRAKDVGKNNYQFYSADMSAAAFERLTLETSLRRALERHEFVLHYQPQIELATGRLLGVEALVRWQHPEFGLLAPTHFIGVAEETGAIVQIGRWALHKAMTEAKRWRELGAGPMRIAVNVSGRQFNDPEFVQTVAALLAETGLPADALVLEITESVIMKNADMTIERVRELHNMGVRFAIDDFGTGYSSLSYLRRFPIQTIKIDKSFIRDLTEDSGDAEIVKTIIAMARGLKVDVIAEGVETREQLLFLRAHNCYAAQGYLLSRPVPVDRLAERVSQAHVRPWVS